MIRTMKTAGMECLTPVTGSRQQSGSFTLFIDQLHDISVLPGELKGMRHLSSCPAHCDTCKLPTFAQHIGEALRRVCNDTDLHLGRIVSVRLEHLYPSTIVKPLLCYHTQIFVTERRCEATYKLQSR